MELPSPQNPAEAAYTAVAILSDLLGLLVAKNLISDDDVSRLIGLSATHLDEAPNFNSKSAANFLRRLVKN
jgi:hypothetical protein